MRTAWVVTALMALGMAAGAAEMRAGTSVETVRLTTGQAAIFKDGYALVMKHGAGELNARGELTIPYLPESAVLGSFWVTSDTHAVRGLVAGLRTVAEGVLTEAPCMTAAESVAANLGRDVELILKAEAGRAGDGRLRGRIARLVLPTLSLPPVCLNGAACARDDCALPRPHTHRANDPDTGRFYYDLRLDRAVDWGWPDVDDAPPASNATPPVPLRHGWRVGDAAFAAADAFEFVLETAQGEQRLSTDRVASLWGEKQATTLMHDRRAARAIRQLTVRMDGNPGERRDVTLSYFTPGIRWIPSYRVDLPTENGGLARIRLQGEILNELEDLDGVKTYLVVGVPNFRFKDMPSPFTMQTHLQNTLMQAAPELMRRAHGQGRAGEIQMMSNALMSQRVAFDHYDAAPAPQADATGGFAMVPDVAGDAAQDLFFYETPALSMRRGDRASVNLFEADAAFREVYTWDLHIRRQHPEHGRNNPNQEDPLRLQTNPVWRRLEMTNATNVPWTTGPAFFMQDGRPVAQELLTYTPAGGRVRVPITAAVDVRGTWREREKKRTLKALRWNGHDYSLIETAADLKIQNFKKTAVALEIRVDAGGEVDTTTPAAEATASGGEYNPNDWWGYWWHMSLNRHLSVTWKTTVEPGQTFSPTLDFRYYWFW